MKIALIGYGKVGRMIDQFAQQQGHTITARIDSRQKINAQAIQDAQVCIDFSHPDCVVNNIKQVMDLGKDLVVGTTGWYKHLEEVTSLIHRYPIGLIYSPNFAIGVQLFFEIVKKAAVLLNPHVAYDVSVLELHHNQKADSPSGTAKTAAKAILERISRKKIIVEGNVEGKIPSEVLQISSLRCGSNPGKHSVIFDSTADSITITHESRNRDGFALGALAAAQWVHGRKGLYTVADMLEIGL